MTPLDITHRWTWTGDRTLPDWLTGHHHWHHDRPVIHTIDGPRTLYTGWLVALWTDGAITVGSTTVAHRVYGDDGLVGRLAAAEAEADRLRTDIAGCRAQQWPQRLARAEAELAGVRALNPTKEN